MNVVRLPGGDDPDTFVQRHGRDAYLAELKRSQPYLEFLLERAASAHNLTRDDSRREFLQKMLEVAARIPDPATRDQFADRLAHKARVTEEVVRAEIRKAAAARRTTLPARLTATGHPRHRHRTRAAVGDPAPARGLRPRPFDPCNQLIWKDLPQRACCCTRSSWRPAIPAVLPSALMERLNDREAQMLARAGAERQAPVLDLGACVQALQNLRVRRELSEIESEIGRLATRDPGVGQAHGTGHEKDCHPPAPWRDIAASAGLQ